MEAAKASSGVRMSRSRPPQPRMPPSIKAPQRRALAMQAGDTAVFIFPYSLAPKSWDTTTEQPMLHPKAKARKISVTS